MVYFIRYACVGVLGTVVDATVLYIIVHYLKVPLLVGVSFSFIVATTCNFILNKIWTFKDSSKDHPTQYLIYLTISFIGLLITLQLVAFFVTFHQVWYIWAKIITSGILMVFNFTLNSLITFREKN